MTVPNHNSPRRRDRTAHAPYNFVPLPDIIVPAPPLPERDRYDLDRYTGIIHCELTTETPLYTRSALEWDEYGGIDVSDKPTFFYVDPETKQPVIPGSSLRGMLRSMVEIVSFSKLQPVTDKQLFFRTMDRSSVKDAYFDRMSSGIRGGFFRTTDGGYRIQPAFVGRIPYDDQGSSYHLFRHPVRVGDPPNQRPNWDLQHKAVWVRLHPDANQDVTRFRNIQEVSTQDRPGLQAGVLVITGWAPRKRAEFVFVPRKGPAVPVSREMYNRFHDDDQLTQWQKDAFPVGQPPGAERPQDGWLRDNEPVFYLLEDGELRFFGRAGKFRLPYRNSPSDMLPGYSPDSDTTTSEIVDMAEGIFGRVDERATRHQQIAGRVYVGDGRLAAEVEDDVWELPPEGRLPRILSSPKPTTVQHYLTQDYPDDVSELRHYESTKGTTLRGHKLYWHKRSNLPQDAWSESTDAARTTQHTGSIRPVRAGVVFGFDIRFENLRAEELGSLLWVLKVAAHDQYRLKLGMVKPYGLGTVRLTHSLHCDDRRQWYKKLFSPEGWQHQAREVNENDVLRAFENYVLQHLSDRRGSARTLSELSRIRDFLRVLTWEGPGTDQTAYMSLDGFQDRRVLPSADKVASVQIAPILEPEMEAKNPSGA